VDACGRGEVGSRLLMTSTRVSLKPVKPSGNDSSPSQPLIMKFTEDNFLKS
jgi:hypothetical protein